RRAFDYRLPAVLPAAASVEVGTMVRVPLHGRRVRGWVVERDVAEPGVDDADLRDVVGVVSAGPPADVVELCRGAAWRWAGPRAAFLRAASPPNLVAPTVEPERETAVYPDRLDAAHPWRADALVVVPTAYDPTETAEDLVAPVGSTIVVDPDPVRAARLE